MKKKQSNRSNVDMGLWKLSGHAVSHLIGKLQRFKSDLPQEVDVIVTRDGLIHSFSYSVGPDGKHEIKGAVVTPEAK